MPRPRALPPSALFELDADVFKIDVSAAQSELDEARARLSLAADEAARQAQLMEHNAAPAARAKQTAIEVQIVRAVVARKESALARAELALSHTHVVAPISGNGLAAAIIAPCRSPSWRHGTWASSQACRRHRRATCRYKCQCVVASQLGAPLRP